MSVNLAQHVQNKVTPQTEAVPGREKEQVENNAGGMVFSVGDWSQLKRWLILGSTGGTYYATERELTKNNAAVVSRCLDADGARTVELIASVSEKGVAPKNDAAIFALALAACHKDVKTKRLAGAALTRVCRTGTHLFQFVAAVDQLRGWGYGLRRAVANWYTSKTPDQLAYQCAKYQSRDGWSHRDVLRLCSPKKIDETFQAIARWIVSGMDCFGPRAITRGKGDKAVTKVYPPIKPMFMPVPIAALEQLKRVETADEVVNLLNLYEDKCPRELVPTKFLADPKVWARAGFIAASVFGYLTMLALFVGAVGRKPPSPDAASRLT